MKRLGKERKKRKNDEYKGRKIKRLNPSLTHWFLSIHCIHPEFPVFFGKRLQGEDNPWLILRRQVEAEPFVYAVGHPANARPQHDGFC